MSFRTLRLGLTAGVTVALLAGCGTSSGGTSSSGGAKKDSSVNTRAALYSSLPASVKKAGKIVAGSQLASPPVIYLKDDGKTVAGVNFDLAQALSTQLGVPIAFQQTSFPALTPSLQSGKIDAAFDLMSDNAERQKTFDFVDFVHNGLTYLVRAGNPQHINKVSDLCGKSVAGVQGTDLVSYAQTASKKCAAGGKKPIKVLQFTSASNARLQVQNGKCAAFLGQTPIMLYLAKTAGKGKTFAAVIDHAYPTETIGMAMAKNDTQLRASLQKALQALIKNGTYRKVLDKYGLGDLAVSKATINAGS